MRRKKIHCVTLVLRHVALPPLVHHVNVFLIEVKEGGYVESGNIYKFFAIARIHTYSSRESGGMATGDAAPPTKSKLPCTLPYPAPTCHGPVRAGLCRMLNGL